MGTTMQGTFTTPQSHITTHLGRIGRDPARLIAVGDYWAEFDAPVELLDDPQTTFTEDGHELLKLCLANGIPYRPAGDGQAIAFPVWLLREFYPANP
ncbi:hypothetical protein [Afipia birgiae]|jgi:hypothetical protein|uniref:hypothetical protein n=1 Tax=Afipia birgiae TaxID=151414 RepID=UPI00037369B4|nr:hypothetical protein [Afipia birgiae]MBX9821205.1 hypothetical protein [Afipia birgiae]